MKIHTKLKSIPKDHLNQFILANFFSNDQKVSIDIFKMYHLMGFLCRYDFDPEKGFIFIYRQLPLEKEYYFDLSEEENNYKSKFKDQNLHPSLANAIFEENEDNDLLSSSGTGQDPLKVSFVNDLIKHNPEQYLKCNLELLENLSQYPKLIISKWWYFIPVGFRIIQPSPTPYLDQISFLKTFKEALGVLLYHPNLVNEEQFLKFKNDIKDKVIYEQVKADQKLLQEANPTKEA